MDTTTKRGLFAALAAALGIAATSPAEAKTTTRRYYSASGRYTGRTVRSGKTTRSYDASGRYRGRSVGR